MRTEIAYGLEHLELEVGDDRLVVTRRQPQAPPLADPAAAVADALESPLGFPPLRRALTPDDHVAVVVDEELPMLGRLLTPVLEHITRAHVRPEAITLLCLPGSSSQEWVDDLPDAFQEVRTEVHDPGNRKRLSYLATTRRGHRIYMNRTLVDADQLVVLTRRGYDPVLGYAGAEVALYPALGDEEAQRQSWERLTMTAPGSVAWPGQQEAVEVAWLLGVPFLVQVIEGADSDLAHILGGPMETSGEGRRLLDARWRVEVEGPADTVVVGVGGEPARHTFADLARALACAARVVKRGGRVVLLSSGEPELGEAAALLRQEGEPAAVIDLVRKQHPAEGVVAFQWASAAAQATVYLLSGLPGDTAEELFTVPLDHAGQVQRLLRDGSCLFLSDAQKTLAEVRKR
jgi:nickel-dependent lactate racemase